MSDSDDQILFAVFCAVVLIFGTLVLAVRVSDIPDAQETLQKSVDYAAKFDYIDSMAYFQETVKIVIDPNYLETATCIHYQDTSISRSILVDIPGMVYPDTEYATYRACVFPNGTILKKEFLGNFTAREANRRFFFL